MEPAKNLPGGVGALSPHLVCDGAAQAIDFYQRAFGAEELMRIPGKDGKLIHACVRINSALVMIIDEFPEFGNVSPKRLNGTPVTIHLNVENVDAVAERAVAAGATIIMPVKDEFWGDRYGILEDPFGHRWSIATPGAPKTAEEIIAAM